MHREACLAIIAACCVFSIIPFTRLSFPSPAGPLLSIILLFAVLIYFSIDIKKLYEAKKTETAKKSVLLMLGSITFAFIALVIIWYYFRFYILPPLVA